MSYYDNHKKSKKRLLLAACDIVFMVKRQCPEFLSLPFPLI